MADEWIYRRNADNSARFVLGKVGDNPLVCVGVNPSTAAPGDLDPTVTKVTKFASRNDFDSWAMLNLYPQRSTDPTGMHQTPSPALRAENEKRIAAFVDGRALTVLAAWGELMDSREYLPQMLGGILALPELARCTWVSIGDLLATKHPRHPSRASYDWPLKPFEVERYLEALDAKAKARVRKAAVWAARTELAGPASL